MPVLVNRSKAIVSIVVRRVLCTVYHRFAVFYAPFDSLFLGFSVESEDLCDGEW